MAIAVSSLLVILLGCRQIQSQCATTTLWSAVCRPDVTASLPASLPICVSVFQGDQSSSIPHIPTLEPGAALSNTGDPRAGDDESSTLHSNTGGADSSTSDPHAAGAVSSSRDPRAGDAAQSSNFLTASMSISTVSENKTASIEIPSTTSSAERSFSSLRPNEPTSVITSLITIEPQPASDTSIQIVTSAEVQSTNGPEMQSSMSTILVPSTSTVATDDTFSSSAISTPASSIASITSSTLIASSVTATPSFVADPGRFLIVLPDKRYLNRIGELQGDCSTATSFALTGDGRLTPSDDNNNVVSVDIGVNFGPLSLFNPGRAIQSTWSFLQNSTLIWTSQAFAINQTTFCEGANNVIAYYQQVAPPDCETVNLGGQDVSACPGYIGDGVDANSMTPSSVNIVTANPTAPLTSVPSELILGSSTRS